MYSAIPGVAAFVANAILTVTAVVVVFVNDTLHTVYEPTGTVYTVVFAPNTFPTAIGVSNLPVAISFLRLSLHKECLSKDWYGTILPDTFTLAAYEEALGHPLTLLSIKNSLVYASLATVLDIVLGVAIAYVVVRSTLPGRHLLDGMAMMPLAVPGLVLAFGYLAMTRDGQFFDFLMLGDNPILLLVIAYAVRRLPYVVRSAAAGFQQTSVSLEEAAQNLGASPFKALRKITLPLISANILAGGLLAFAFAMLEVSDSLILATKQAYYPITTAMYALFNALGNGEKLASALGVWAMAFLAITIIGASLILGKKMGALFRI